MRRTLEREAPERLKVKMWLFPYLTYFAIAAMVAVIGAMALVEDVRAQLIPSFISLAVVLGRLLVQEPVRTPLGSRAGRRHLTPEPGHSARRLPSHAR